ncbi:hypothetical protein [Variovorax sp. GT1P44]|uniref:hypothetical protein n=1 Tax=Variovorax sp. GT1P44 TaxID=3443742 RepID=UPI003F4860A7
MKAFHLHLLPPVLALLLAACASDPSRLAVGSSRAQALQQLGKPTATYPLPDGGERLQYSTEPYGYEVNNVDLNAAGQVVAVRSELAAPLVNNPIQIGKWREADILRTYGKPFQVTRVDSFDGTIWSWHIQQNYLPYLFYVYFDPAGVVVRYSVSPQ